MRSTLFAIGYIKYQQLKKNKITSDKLKFIIFYQD